VQCKKKKEINIAPPKVLYGILPSRIRPVVYFVRVITFVNVLYCKPLQQKETFYRLYAKMVNHVASIVAIFQLLQTNWIRVERARYSNSDYNPNRPLHLAYAYNSGYCYSDKLQKTRKGGKWKRKSEREKEREHEIRMLKSVWTTKIRKRYQRGCQSSNYGSSNSIAAKNHGRKRPAEKAKETNLSGLSSARMMRSERSGSRRRLVDLMS